MRPALIAMACLCTPACVRALGSLWRDETPENILPVFGFALCVLTLFSPKETP